MPSSYTHEMSLFPTNKDVQRVYKRALNAMRRCLKAAGLPTHHGLHSLRHTYATGLIAAGVSPAFVQQQLGHADISMTVNVYGSWLPVIVPGAVDALADSMSEALGHQLDTQAPKSARNSA